MRCFNFCVGEIDIRADISHHPGRRSSRRGAWLISDELIQDVDLSKQDQAVKRHDGSPAPPIKDRPRRGHIGFQYLSRDDVPVVIRGARIKA